MDKGHGRIEHRQLWCQATDPQTIGLAGTAQVVRLRRHTQQVRKGCVIKETTEVVFAVTSFLVSERIAAQLLGLARDHWSIENGQHYRRDRTQDEDRCSVRAAPTARNLSLFRSLAIFLFKRQAQRRRGQKSLPDFERQSHRHPNALIDHLVTRRQDE